MNGTIRLDEIAQGVRRILDPFGRRTIDWDEKIGRYIHGGSGAVQAFADVLNRSPQFADYSLNLGPHHMTPVKLVRDLIAVIADWLRANGWKIVI